MFKDIDRYVTNVNVSAQKSSYNMCKSMYMNSETHRMYIWSENASSYACVRECRAPACMCCVSVQLMSAFICMMCIFIYRVHIYKHVYN